MRSTFGTVWLIGSIIVLLLNCVHTNLKRPENVPEQAVAVFGSKTVWWQHCELTEPLEEPECLIWNRAGLNLYHEKFLPLDEGRLPTAEELIIWPDGPLAGPDWIYLQNGRLLLPKSRFKELKQFYQNGVGN